MYTQIRSVGGLIKGDTIRFENSIGVMNLQQYFSAPEKILIRNQYVLEDILAHRMISLANLTCVVVFDEPNNTRNNP